MANVVKTLILGAAVLAIQTAQAADPATSTAPPALNGAQLFATHCAMCHKPAELARRLQSAPDPKSARADMASFLAGHGRIGCRRGSRGTYYWGLAEPLPRELTLDV